MKIINIKYYICYYEPKKSNVLGDVPTPGIRITRATYHVHTYVFEYTVNVMGMEQ